MDSFLPKNILTVVMFILVSGFVGNAWGGEAEDKAAAQKKYENDMATCESKYKNNPTLMISCTERAGKILDTSLGSISSRYTSPKEECIDLKKKLDEATKKIGEICGKIEMSAEDEKSCAEQVKSCQLSRSGSNENDTIGSILNGTTAAAGTHFGAPGGLNGLTQGSSIAKGCPQLGDESYFNRKDKIEDKLEKLNEKSTKTIEDLNKAEKEVNEDSRKTQQSISDAKRQLDQDKRDMQKAQQEELADLIQNQSKLNKSIRERETAMITIQRNMARADSTYAAKLLKFSNDQGKTFCAIEVQKLQKDLPSSAQGSLNNLSSSATSKKQILLQKYISCMEAMEQERANAEKEHADEIRIQQKAYDDMQQEIVELKNQSDSMTQQVAQSQQRALQGQIAAEQATLEKMMLAQKALQENQTTLQKQRMASMFGQVQTSRSIENVNQEFASLPSKATGSAYNGLQEAASALTDVFKAACTNNEEGIDANIDSFMIKGVGTPPKGKCSQINCTEMNKYTSNKGVYKINKDTLDATK